MDQIRKRGDVGGNRFSANPENSYTIPAHLYFEPQFLEDEKREVFWKSWIFVGHVSEVRDAGQYITAEFCDQRVFVIRNTKNELNAFFNVCQHRGHSLLKGKGSARQLLVCPYHAWSYDHDGQLISANNCNNVQDFDKGEFTLPTVRVEEFCGFIFVNLDPDARPMSEVYPGASEVLMRFAQEPENLVPGRVIPYDIQGNWKNVGDNALECYHCSTAHKAFVDLVEMDTYKVETDKYWSLQYGKCRPDNSAYAFDEIEGHNDFMTLFLWPNMTFVTWAGTKGVAVFLFHPLTPDSTHLDFIYYSPEATLNPTETKAMDYFQNVLGPEDLGLVEDVQKGLKSLGYHQGRVMTDKARTEISEHALHHFQNLVATEMKDYI